MAWHGTALHSSIGTTDWIVYLTSLIWRIIVLVFFLFQVSLFNPYPSLSFRLRQRHGVSTCPKSIRINFGKGTRIWTPVCHFIIKFEYAFLFLYISVIVFYRKGAPAIKLFGCWYVEGIFVYLKYLKN